MAHQVTITCIVSTRANKRGSAESEQVRCDHDKVRGGCYYYVTVQAMTSE